MKAGISQSTQLKQEIKINPRLYQAMDLLYMPLLDLQQHLAATRPAGNLLHQLRYYLRKILGGSVLRDRAPATARQLGTEAGAADVEDQWLH